MHYLQEADLKANKAKQTNGQSAFKTLYIPCTCLIMSKILCFIFLSGVAAGGQRTVFQGSLLFHYVGSGA